VYVKESLVVVVVVVVVVMVVAAALALALALLRWCGGTWHVALVSGIWHRMFLFGRCWAVLII
jgi:hypothetical protein